MNKAGIDFSGANAAGGITDAQAAEITAANAAGYPIPLRPSEVRETFAGGRRITYNARESLANGEIIPPSNSLAFAGGTGGDFSRLADVFTAGATKQTDATKRLEASQKELRAELKRLAEAAIANSTAIKEQTSSLKNSAELTAKTGTPEAPKTEGGAAGGGKEFTSLEKIGGGRRTLNLAPRGPMIGLEGTAPGLRAAGDLGGGFANSPAFEAARKKAELLKMPVQGPPIAPFLQQQAIQQQIAPKPEVDPEVALRALIEEISRGLNGVTTAITRQGSLNVSVV